MKRTLVFCLFFCSVVSAFEFEQADQKNQSQSVASLSDLLKCLKVKELTQSQLKVCAEKHIDSSVGPITQMNYVQFFQQDLKLGPALECPEKSIRYLPEEISKKSVSHLCFQEPGKKRKRDLLISFSAEAGKVKIFHIRY